MVPLPDATTTLGVGFFAIAFHFDSGAVVRAGVSFAPWSGIPWGFTSSRAAPSQTRHRARAQRALLDDTSPIRASRQLLMSPVVSARAWQRAPETG
jgi:hypothetical protein